MIYDASYKFSPVEELYIYFLEDYCFVLYCDSSSNPGKPAVIIEAAKNKDYKGRMEEWSYVEFHLNWYSIIREYCEKEKPKQVNIKKLLTHRTCLREFAKHAIRGTLITETLGEDLKYYDNGRISHNSYSIRERLVVVLPMPIESEILRAAKKITKRVKVEDYDLRFVGVAQKWERILLKAKCPHFSIRKKVMFATRHLKELAIELNIPLSKMPIRHADYK